MGIRKNFEVLPIKIVHSKLIGKRRTVIIDILILRIWLRSRIGRSPNPNKNLGEYFESSCLDSLRIIEFKINDTYI